MNPNQEAFLVDVLGPDGAEALLRAVRKSEALSNVLLPRTLLSWASLIGTYGFQGPVPGVDNTFLEFKKTDDSYSGALTIGSDTIPFTDSSSFRLAAHLAVALGIDEVSAPELRGIDLQKLGKSIDLLVKSRATRKAELGHIHKPCPLCGEKQKNLTAHLDSAHEYEMADRRKNPDDPVVNELKGDTKKTELPGPSAHPLPQGPPQGPIAPTKQPKIKQAAKPQLPALKVGKSEMAVKCNICGKPQFQAGQFTGCLCLAALAKTAKTVNTKAGDAILTFGSGWDIDSIEVLIEALHQ